MTRENITPEEFARRVIARELRKDVVEHDDGSQPSMYDLRVGATEAPDVAIECIRAVDPIGTATWNAGPARGPIRYNLSGDWHVVLQRSARVKEVRARLERILQDLEAEGRLQFTPVNWRLKRERPDIFERLSELLIESTSCFRPDGSGDVHLGMPSIGGRVDSTGSAVPAWLSEFLGHPNRSDVLSKLKNSRASECHVFIPVSFNAVPWAVESYLGEFSRSVPVDPPVLPEPVTQVWIAYGGRCLRWNGVIWSDFVVDVIPTGQDAA
jgi:hypothetical protein